MRILSFDTSTNEIHLSLVEAGRVQKEMVVAEVDAQTRQEAVAALMPSVVSLMADVGWQKQELDCIVVGEGPGSFTGVRTGVVTGRSMAQGLNLPLVPVNLIECHASICDLPGAIVLSAGRGRYFVAAFNSFDEKSGSFDVAVEPASISTNQLVETLGAMPVWYLDDKAISELNSALNEPSIQMRPLPKLENIATKQAQIAWRRLSLKLSEICSAGNGGKKSDAAANSAQSTMTLTERQAARDALLEVFPYQPVTPLYLRSPSITLKKPAPEQANGS